MENASQALIIAGGILIAIIVLSVGIYLFVNYSKVSESYGQSQTNKEINKFNTNFTKYMERTNITAQEIITLKNFAESYDKKNGTKTIVDYPNKKEADDDDIKKQSYNDAEFIMEYSLTEKGQLQYYSCKEIEYDKNGRIKSIKFEKNS